VIDGVAGTAVPHPEENRWEIPEGAQFALLDAGREVDWRSPVPVYFPARDERELTRARELGAHGIVIAG
jgi:hypothetical protein